MGRRREIPIHFDTGEVVPHHSQSRREKGETEPVPLCRNTDFWSLKVTSKEEQVDCSACRRIMANRFLKSADAPKMTLSPDHDAGGYDWRYFFKVFLGEEQVGWIGYAGAYGKGAWSIIALSTNKDDDEKIEKGRALCTESEEKSYERGDGATRTYWTDPRDHHYQTKEDALLAIPDWVARGKLRSIPDTIARAKTHRIELARRREAYARRTADEQQAHADMIEGLVSLQTRAHGGEIVLNNFEAAALDSAIAKLRKTEP